MSEPHEFYCGLVVFFWFLEFGYFLTQWYLFKDLSPEVRDAQEKKLEGIKKQQEIHIRLAVERKIFLRDRKIKFFGKILFILCLSLHFVAKLCSQ